MRTIHAAALALLLGALAFSLPACAAKGLRNQTRVAALGVGDAVVGISQAESQIYKGGTYDKATHDTLNDAIVKLLYAARGFERTAAAWPEGKITPAMLTDSRDALLGALSDFEKLIPAGKAHDAFDAAVAAVRTALNATRAQLEVGPVNLAEMPGGGVLALLSIIAGLVSSGRSTVERILAALKAEGATDEELAGVDVRLTEEILRREAEKAADKDPASGD